MTGCCIIIVYDKIYSCLNAKYDRPFWYSAHFRDREFFLLPNLNAHVSCCHQLAPYISSSLETIRSFWPNFGRNSTSIILSLGHIMVEKSCNLFIYFKKSFILSTNYLVDSYSTSWKWFQVYGRIKNTSLLSRMSNIHTKPNLYCK